MNFLRSRSEQLANHLRDCILRWQLVEPLPGMRAWSRQLGVSRPTLNKALLELQGDGLLSIKPRGVQIHRVSRSWSKRVSGTLRMVHILYRGRDFPESNPCQSWVLPISQQENDALSPFINAVVFVVETVGRFIFSIPSLFSAQRDNAPWFRIGDNKKKTVTIVALLAILTSVASLFFTMGDRPAEIDLTPELALGQGMAEETSRLLGNKGEIVVVKLNSKDRKGTRQSYHAPGAPSP